MTWLAALGAGYLLGSIPFSQLVARGVAGIDLRTTGSGNVGAANLLRQTHWAPALAALALDVGKGAVAVWVGAWLGGVGHGALAGGAAVAGHVYPLWLGFAGGKGVATAAGACAMLVPEVTLGAVVAFLVIVWRTRFVSLGSMTAAVLVPILAAVTGATPEVLLMTAVVSALILWRHRGNLARLRAGRERQLGRRS